MIDDSLALFALAIICLGILYYEATRRRTTVAQLVRKAFRDEAPVRSREERIEAGVAAFAATRSPGTPQLAQYRDGVEAALDAACAVDEARIRADERQKVVREAVEWLSLRSACQSVGVPGGEAAQNALAQAAVHLRRWFGNKGGRDAE